MEPGQNAVEPVTLETGLLVAHDRDHVLKELERYGPLVTPGSYMIVQDTRIQDFMPQFGPGPGEAVEEFLETHDEFEIDRERERLLLTYYSGGFLRKTQ